MFTVLSRAVGYVGEGCPSAGSQVFLYQQTSRSLFDRNKNDLISGSLNADACSAYDVEDLGW